MKSSTLLKGLVVISVVVGAPVLGIMTTPKRESVAKAAEEGPVAAASAGASSTATPVATSNFVGVLLPPQMATLSSYTEGRVEHVDVKVGQRVQKGQRLLVMDPRARQQELEAAKGALLAAQGIAGSASAELAAASQKAARRDTSIDVGGKRISIVSGEEKSQALAERGSAAGRATSAAGQIAQQKAVIEQLKVMLENMSPVAPFDGVITALYVEQGATAHNGQPLVRVVGGQGLRARIAVPEESSGVWTGRRRAQLDVEVSGVPRTFWAVIDQVAPEVEPASRAFFVEGPVSANPEMCGGDCALLAGRPVRATLISDKE